jgi:hypothetical protein
VADAVRLRSVAASCCCVWTSALILNSLDVAASRRI